MKKPCNGCYLALQHKQKNRTVYDPDPWLPFCLQCCEKYKKYLEYRDSRRQYCKGDALLSMSDFEQWIDKNTYVFWHDKLKHSSIIISMQYRVVANAVSGGFISQALTNPNYHSREKGQ